MRGGRGGAGVGTGVGVGFGVVVVAAGVATAVAATTSVGVVCTTITISRCLFCSRGIWKKQLIRIVIFRAILGGFDQYRQNSTTIRILNIHITVRCHY